MPDTQAAAHAVAGGAIAAALLDTLHSKGILDLTESRGVLETAMRLIGVHAKTPEGFQASRIIADMLKDRFSARRG